MAINSLTTIKATIQMRQGLERDFDADQMTAGEWAVSTDKKYVRMCFAPGVAVRMATYEAFERDMLEIQTILASCRDIQTAVDAMANLAERHKNAAALSADAARSSELAAQRSEVNACDSATAASASSMEAAGSAAEARSSELAAQRSEVNAGTSAIAAMDAQVAAAESANDADGSANDASNSAHNAAVCVGQAEDFSLISKSYAVGTEGEVRPGDATDNAEYYSNLAQHLTDEAAKLLDQAQKLISAATAGALIPSGTVAFENLPEEPQLGYMYNISNDFVTDERFAEGAGIRYNPGANVYWTKDGLWDVMIGVQVTGVKGAAESYYRQGNVNITPVDIGLGNVPNVTTNDQAPTFVQTASRENINSGETTSALWGKVKKWLVDLKAVAFSGSYNDLADKPAIGNGTVTIKQAGADKGSFAMNQTGNATIELTDNNTTYGVVTSSQNGLMASGDKSKLDGVAANANKTTITNNLLATAAGTALDATQGKALNDKITKINSDLSKLGNMDLWGKIYSVSAFPGREVTGNAVVCSMSVPAGIYIVTGAVSSQTDGTYFSIGFCEEIYVLPRASVPGYSNGNRVATANVTDMVQFTSQGTINLWITPYKSMNIYQYLLKAIKIA